MSETTQITNQNQQKKIDFRKIIHINFVYGHFHKTFRPMYILYFIDNHRVFVARSKKGRIVAIHMNYVNYAFMRTRNYNLAIDIIDLNMPGGNMPGGEIMGVVRIDNVNIDEKDDVVIIKYHRDGEDREIVASSQVIKFLRSLMYNYEVISVLDAVINYTNTI